MQLAGRKPRFYFTYVVLQVVDSWVSMRERFIYIGKGNNRTICRKGGGGGSTWGGSIVDDMGDSTGFANCKDGAGRFTWAKFEN